MKNQYTDLNYSDERYSFGIEINVYAQDMTIDNKRISKRTICNEITCHVVEYYKTNYRVTIKVEQDVPNIDSNVHRNIIKITGIVDTKYGFNNLIIYPG